MMKNGDDGTTNERNKREQSDEEHHESEKDEGYQNKHIYRQAYIYLS